VPDLSVPDLSVPDLSLPGCTTKYGDISGFILCEQTSTSCLFFFNNSGSCDNLCGARGGTCLNAYNDDTNGCTWSSEGSCSSSYGDSICRCTR
jgi:hypothetical protein